MLLHQAVTGQESNQIQKKGIKVYYVTKYNGYSNANKALSKCQGAVLTLCDEFKNTFKTPQKVKTMKNW